MTPQQKRMTYLALTKMCMPNLAEVFADGTVGAVLSAHAVPIKLKYECPQSSKFDKGLPPWKTATSCFLNIVYICLTTTKVTKTDSNAYDLRGSILRRANLTTQARPIARKGGDYQNGHI